MDNSRIFGQSEIFLASVEQAVKGNITSGESNLNQNLNSCVMKNIIDSNSILQQIHQEQLQKQAQLARKLQLENEIKQQLQTSQLQNALISTDDAQFLLYILLQKLLDQKFGRDRPVAQVTEDRAYPEELSQDTDKYEQNIVLDDVLKQISQTTASVISNLQQPGQYSKQPDVRCKSPESAQPQDDTTDIRLDATTPAPSDPSNSSNTDSTNDKYCKRYAYWSQSEVQYAVFMAEKLGSTRGAVNYIKRQFPDTRFAKLNESNVRRWKSQLMGSKECKKSTITKGRPQSIPEAIIPCIASCMQETLHNASATRKSLFQQLEECVRNQTQKGTPGFTEAVLRQIQNISVSTQHRLILKCKLYLAKQQQQVQA